MLECDVMADSELNVLLALIDQAFDHKSWHGTNLRGALRAVSPEQAAWRPAPTRHNIWEVAVHAAYWKYIVRRRLTSEARGSFPIKGSNWFERPGPGTFEAGLWKADLALLTEMHIGVRAAVAELAPRELHRTPAGSKVSNLALITGIAAHDLYHAGQIQLLKRFNNSLSMDLDSRR
jgi:uncharacterized damage-inducible protein DinB